jgi:hypothetical protein
MAATLQVVGKSGTVKKIASKNFNRTMGGDGAWFSEKASTVNVKDYLDFTDVDLLLIQAGQYVELEFVADSGGSDGQGTSVPVGLAEVKVTAVKGTCKGLRAENATLATTKTEAYASGSAFNLAVDDLLLSADMAVCDRQGIFTLKFTAFGTSGPYVAIPAVRLYTEPR